MPLSLNKIAVPPKPAPCWVAAKNFLAILMLALLPGWATGQSIESCRATLKNDTLVLENAHLVRRFRWNNGHLITLSLTDKMRQKTWQWASREPDCAFPGHATPTGEGELATRQIVKQPNQTDHLEVSVTTQLGTLSVRRVFWLHPRTATLTGTFYLRGKASAEWQQSIHPGIATRGGKGIESQKDLNESAGSAPVMERLSLAGNHWQLRTVVFTDQTDRNNTLVTATSYTLYRQPGFLRGNFLRLTDGLSGDSFFVLKESPLSAMQLADPGYDFLVKQGSIQIAGVGILPGDLSESEWTRGYGYTLGLGGTTELETLQTLRSYQDAKRPRRPDRDEMIVMNTWGDRNKDAKVDEQFITKEIRKAAQLGITRFQIDDGWQSGRSMNSAFEGGSSDGIYQNGRYWMPNPHKFPNGLKPVVEAAKKLDMELGLWFSPSPDSSYANWRKDAQTLIGLYRSYGIRTFKIDLVRIEDKRAEINFRRLFDSVLVATHYEVVFNFDVTADRRNGYHYFNEYGNLFLENRYTDWTNYYPYWTLRNLWNLSKYVPPQNLQIEFLNKWRNHDKYPAGDRFAPANYAFNYLFATTMMAQPLAWFEATGLPEEAFQTAPLIRNYRTYQTELHSGQIFPIGEEPSGKSWTGFQSMVSEKKGFILVFREDNDQATATVRTWFSPQQRIRFRAVAGAGKDAESVVTAEGKVAFTLPAGNSFALYRYEVLK